MFVEVTLGTNIRPSVTVTVRCVWTKNNVSIQSGCSPEARENLRTEWETRSEMT